MLLVRFRALLSDQSTCSRMFEIGRVRGGSIGDYHIIERDIDGSVITEGELLQYPRWSEHTSGLAARCLQTLWCSRGPRSTPQRAAFPDELNIECARIETGLGSHETGIRLPIERIEYVRTGFAPRVRVARENWSAFEYPAPVKLAADTGAIVVLLALATWSTTDIAELPRLLAVPVYAEDDGPPFVRLMDTPEPTRTAFDRWMEGATVPALDCAYAWDWTRFVEGT